MPTKFLLLLFITCFSCTSTQTGVQTKMSPQAQLTKQSAQAIAETAIRSLKPEADFVVLEAKTLERDFGWVFFYTPRRYLETGDPGALVPGAGPLVVLRDGSTQFLSTSLPPDRAVERFEEQWRSRSR